ncbi:hypothetical protein [Microbispora sp. NPDC049125]|uniref:hypothetical protein n=1 Tax=Microbispora sp. NPDC049125 TaxID=3154929 RepID=UPI00346601A0
MSLTNDVVRTPIEPRTVAFGTVEATVDYSQLRALGRDKYPAYFNSTFRLLTADDTEIWPHIAEFREEDRTWLAHAVFLYGKNLRALPRDFDHAGAMARLMRRASVRTAMPGAQNDAFEREALRAGGWVSTVVVKALTPPGQDLAARLNLIYNPPGSDKGEDGTAKVGVLRKDVLAKELIPELVAVVDEQLAHWVRPRGVPQEMESIHHLQLIADFLQKYVALRLRPYADAWENGPYFDGFRYSERLQSTWELPNQHPNRLNWLLNRAQAIGWDKQRGALLAKADYDGTRPGDSETLHVLLDELLSTDALLSKKVGTLVKLTGAHTGGEGKISIQPIFPSPSWGTKADWRWRLIRTLVHELMHRLAHPAFTAKAKEIRHGQIIGEGFVDLLATDVYIQLCRDVTEVRSGVEILLHGLDATVTPDPSFLKVGYGEAGASATAVRDLVGDDRVRAAFFLGATHLIGLPLT